MKCGNCGQEILQAHPDMCPYCRSKNLLSEEDESKTIKEIAQLEKAGRFEDAALRYATLELWDKAKECRMLGRKNHAGSAKLKNGKIGAVNMICPHCNESQPIASKSAQETCNRCGTTYLIPEKVRELIAFDGKS